MMSEEEVGKVVGLEPVPDTTDPTEVPIKPEDYVDQFVDPDDDTDLF